MSQQRPPLHVRIKDGIVECQHRGCFHLAGPYPDRTATVTAAWAHHTSRHSKEAA